MLEVVAAAGVVKPQVKPSGSILSHSGGRENAMGSWVEKRVLGFKRCRDAVLPHAATAAATC